MQKRLFQVGGTLMAVLALCALLLLPGRASAASLKLASQSSPDVLVNANVYLTGGMLAPIFQTDINQQVPQAVSAAIASMVNQLPQADQSWASQMAGALLQPTATLVSLKPQAAGLLVTLQVDLYAGDPKPTTTDLLVGFSVADPSTIQVSALPINGKTGLVSGPLLNFHMPIGSLNKVTPTTQCSDADLAINLKFPIALSSSGQSSTQSQAAPVARAAGGANAMDASLPALNASPTAVPQSYIELPEASLAQLGSSLGNITVSTSLTAKNIRIGIQGKDLTLTSDIYWHSLGVGTAVSTLVPGASGGNLVMSVTSTKLSILGGLISFPLNSYNQQIQTILNSDLNGALAGKFFVQQAAVGPNSHLSCAAANSLLLGGTISLA